jgi:predicted AlkP superfamily pyrophosphatase or phosphodiesterase
MAHHDGKAQISLDETVEFAKAIEAAVDLTSEDDTLIVVTSDHSHTLSLSGYAVRGNNIFGKYHIAYSDTCSSDKLVVFKMINFNKLFIRLPNTCVLSHFPVRFSRILFFSSTFKANTVLPGYNDIGLRDTSFIASDIL